MKTAFTKPSEEDETKDDDDKQYSVRFLILDYFEYTSGHGPPRILASKQLVRKIFWTLLFLAALGVSSWQIATLFETYKSRPLSTHVAIQHETVREVCSCTHNCDSKWRVVVDDLYVSFCHISSIKLWSATTGGCALVLLVFFNQFFKFIWTLYCRNSTLSSFTEHYFWSDNWSMWIRSIWPWFKLTRDQFDRRIEANDSNYRWKLFFPFQTAKTIGAHYLTASVMNFNISSSDQSRFRI